MRSTTFARLALFLPYLLLVESVVYFVFYDISGKDSWLQDFNIVWNFLAIFWVLPYSILVIILLKQSKGKTFVEIKRIFLTAPFKLMFIAPACYVVILMIGTLIKFSFFEDTGRLLAFAAAFSVPASLILGYVFLGISLLLHKVLLKIGILKEDIQRTDLEIENLQSLT